ncbi:hypothetical protein ETC02_18120, partial [Geobacillus sp. DSP4a]|nr:hypothetical protein [Geobacillus sp. DSP4a]
ELEQLIEEVDQHIDRLLEPYREEVDLLMTMPGIKKQTAAVIILTFRTLTRSKQRIFYLVFQNNFLTNTTSDGYPFFTIAGRSV